MGIPINLLQDSHGRRFPYLRLSLTEACNFRCTYCLPDGYRAQGRPAFLAPVEIGRLVSAMARLGMHKIRLSGGEPSLRKDLVEVIATVAGTPGVEQVALTTNGRLLERKVAQWRTAGLTTLNVSLDSLDPGRFAAITGDAHFHQITQGIETALGLDFAAVKINVVLLRGCNDDELPAWLEYVRKRRLSVRFIELMRTGDNSAFFQRHHVAPSALEASLLAAGWARTSRQADAGPALEYTHPGYLGRIGFITPYAPGFCTSCNRLRVTARGDLRLCLFADSGIPLRHLLQSDADLPALVDLVSTQLRLKATGHGLAQGLTGLTPHLASIGG